jgi:hypothetical protein
MHRNCIRYKDTTAAPGSQLHAALTDKDAPRAEAIYRQCEADARELVRPKVAAPGTLRGPCEYAKAQGETA